MAIITISRGTFSGGKELAECIAQRMGYLCISREVLVTAASNYGVPLDRLSAALTDRPGIFEGMTLERAHYVAYIRASLAKYASGENLVYHGHAGHLLLKNVPHVLRVKVMASMEYRIKAAMERRNLTHEQAVEFIRKIDRDRERWTKFLYHVDWNDISLYDLVVNLDRMTMNGACELITMLADREEFQPTPESQKILRDLILASEVRARIAAEPGIHDDGIDVEADDGVITITGSVRAVTDADRIREVARRHPTVKEVISKTGARW